MIEKHLRKRWMATAPAIMALSILMLGIAFAPFAGHARAQEGTPTVTVVSPAGGDVITSDTIDLQVEVENFTLDCAKSGLPDEDGVGHIHVMIDGMTMANLVGFYCDDTISISGAGLEPGTHTLIVGLSTNSHLPLMDTFQMVEIDYQPENPVALPDADFTGTPGVELVSPLDGETVGNVVTIEVTGVNFTATEDFEGKTNVPGYGHWHVFVDTDMSGMMDMGMDDADAMAEEDEATADAEMEGAGMDDMEMMPMLGMVAMPGTDTFELDLSAWGPGEHTIWIEPVQNDHTPYEEFGWVEFTVTVEADA
jgi:hypothetical protein